MGATYTKPKDLRYVDMCIYIDAHFPEVVQDNPDPVMEARLFEYIYHIIYALSFKKMFFIDFKHYDPFALYGASEVYMSMYKKLKDPHKIVHGKEIAPVKSVLNYIKAVLFPLKVGYQNNAYSQIWNPEIGIDTDPLYEDMKESIRTEYRADMHGMFKEAIDRYPYILESVLVATPYREDPLMMQRLRLSCSLTFLDELTLSRTNQTRRNLVAEKIKTTDDIVELDMIYRANKLKGRTVLWHLPPEFEDYVKVLTTKVKNKLSEEVGIAFHETDLSESIVDKIMGSAFATKDLSEEDI